jgi:hypothetical protein
MRGCQAGGMSVPMATLRLCPGFDCCRLLSRRRGYRRTAGTPRQDQTIDRETESSREGSAQGLGRENHHRPGTAIRRDQSRGPRRTSNDPVCARHHRATRRGNGPETGNQPDDQPKWLGPARRTLAAQGFRPGRAGPGCLHVATMLGMRARRTRKPQEPSGLRVRILHAGRCNADVNAARNIAAGRAVTARGDLADGRSANREPQLSNPAA